MSSVEEILLTKVCRMETLLMRLLNDKAAETVVEFSLTKTAKILHRSTDTIKQMVEDGKIRASKEIINGKVEYRFTLADIKQYQRNKSYATN